MGRDNGANFDDILGVLGEFGRYQKFQYFLLCIVSIVSAFHSLNMVFVGATPEHFCLVDKQAVQAQVGNITRASTPNLVLPMEKEQGTKRSSSCEKYNFQAVNESDIRAFSVDGNVTYIYYNGTNGGRYAIVNRSKVECDSWEYETDVYGNTIVSEWNLVCDKKWLKSTAKSVFFAGRLVGALLFGQLSDIFGRRPIFFVAVILQLAVGCSVAFSPNMIVFIVLYFFQGVMQVGVFLTAYVIGTELVGPSKRKLAGFIIQYFYSIGYMVLAGIAYVARDWTTIELSITIPGVLFISYWFFLPESARWLLSKNKNEEAIKVLQKAARHNKVELPPEMIQGLTSDGKCSQETRMYSFLDLVRYPAMARISINVWFNWMVNALVYYGLSLNTSNLGGDPYLNFVTAGAVEIPAYTLCLLLLDRTGRRKLLFAFMVIGGVACIITTFIPEGLQSVGILFAMIGKFAITASYGIIYLMAAEVFPTVVRNIGMGVSSMSARIGGILAPQILLLDGVWVQLPLIIFGVSSIVAGCLAMLLPETLGKPLPETLEDVISDSRSTDEAAKRKTDETIM